MRHQDSPGVVVPAASEHSGTRFWRVLAVVAFILALVATLLTVVVADRAARIDEQLRHSNATLIAQQSNQAADARPTTALQMALAAYREKPNSPEAYGALLEQRLYWRGVDRVVERAGEVKEVQASRDGRVVLTVPHTRGGKVALWEGLTTSHPRRRDLPVDRSHALSLSPDGRWLAETDGSVVKLRDLTGRAGQRILRGSDGPVVESVDFGPNGRFLVVRPVVAGDAPLPLEVWETASGRALPSHVSTGTGGIVTQAYPAPDGTAVVLQEAVENGRRTVVRDLATGAEIRSFGADQLLGFGAAAAHCEDGVVTVRNSITGSVRGQRPGVQCPVRWDLSEQYLLLTEEGRDAENYTEAIHWPTWRRHTFTDPAQRRALGAAPVLAGDRSLVSLTLADRTLRSTRLETTKERRKDVTYQPSLTDLSPEKRRWVTFTESGELALLDREGRITRRVAAPDQVDDVSFDTTGEHVLTVAGDTLQIYDGATLTLEHQKALPGSGAGISSSSSILPWSNDEILVARGGRLTYWNPRTAKQTADPLRLGTSGAATVALRPKSSQVLVEQGDELSLWDFEKRQLLRTFPVDIFGSTEHIVDSSGSIAAVISGAGDEIALFDLKREVRLPPVRTEVTAIHGIAGPYLFLENSLEFQVWDWQQRKLVTGIALDDGYRENGRELRDGKLIMDSTPGTTESLRLEAENWYRALCDLSDRGFTTEEARLLPAGVSRERPCADLL